MASGLLFFIVRRGINAIVTLILLILIVFSLIHAVFRTPLQLAQLYIQNPHASQNPAVLESIVKQYHLDAPIYAQAWNYISGVFQGNFGTDVTYKTSVASILSANLPITLEFVLIGTIVGVIIGIFTGAIGAANRNRVPDFGVKGVYLATWASPPFLVALVIQLIVAYHYGLLPSSLYVDPLLSAPPVVTGWPLIDSLLAGNWAYFSSLVQHLVLPALAVAIIGFGVITRIARASMLDSMDKDYVKLAYMKGFSKRQVTTGTVFRNAVIPVITLLALVFAFSASGAIIIEDIFNYHGMGYLIYTASLGFDYTLILGFTIVIGIFVIAANFAADVLYAVADPRVRLE